jgi:hypothetical protein
MQNGWAASRRDPSSIDDRHVCIADSGSERERDGEHILPACGPERGRPGLATRRLGMQGQAEPAMPSRGDGPLGRGQRVGRDAR